MPIRIDYSPVGTLINLARSAGEAQGARESATHDLAFTQMAMQAQTQNAQIASTMQRNNQAFQLQQAAMARQSRTSTRATPSRSPVAQEFDKALGRATVARGWEQQDQTAQLTQLDTLAASGQYTEAQIEGARLAVLGGQSPAQYLLQKKDAERTGLTGAQRESRTRVIHQNQRDVQESILRSLDEERQFEDWTPEKNEWQKRYDAATEKIRVLDVTYGAMQPSRTPSAGTGVPGLGTPQSMPATKADAVIGQTYVDNKGILWRWTGAMMVEITDTNLGTQTKPAVQTTSGSPPTTPVKRQPSSAEIKRMAFPAAGWMAPL